MTDSVSTAPMQDPAADPPSMRILVVDDDRLSLNLLHRFLAESGYDVLTATDGHEAMRIILAEGPRMIITDWLMPGMNGLELCRMVRTHEGVGFVYVIMVTAHSDQGRVVEALDVGADDFLAKPFHQGELLARVRAGERIIRLEGSLSERRRESHLLNAQLAVANDRLRQAALTDELTGLLNRRAALDRLEDAWSQSVRTKSPLSCMILDVDHFKRVNDRYGHAVGDEVLKHVANVLRGRSRRGEPPCRIGGEEFVVMQPYATADMAAAAANRLRIALEQAPIMHEGRPLTVTISLGVAERDSSMRGPEDLLRCADEALYIAKYNGRNQVFVHGMTLGSAGLRRGGAAAPAAAAAPRAPTILVVDSDVPARRDSVQALSTAGIVVMERADLWGAVDEVERAQVDAIVVGERVGEIDGVAAVASLRHSGLPRDVPIIVCGAHGGQQAVAAFEAGADDFIARPWHEGEFVRRVQWIVGLHSERRELLHSNAFRGEQARTLGILLDCSHGLASVNELDEILRRTVSTASMLTHCRRVVVLLPNAERNQLAVAHAVGLDDSVARGFLVPVGTATSGEVFVNGRTLIVNTPEDEAAVRRETDQALFTTGPRVCAAMKASGHVGGVLVVSDRVGAAPFTPLELECIDLISNTAASAIHGLLTRQARDEARDSIVVALAKLAEHRDHDTGEHVERVTTFCVILANALRTHDLHGAAIDEPFLANMERAVPLHDIGKVGIPDDILLKPGKLSPNELLVMRTHCKIGADCLQSVASRAPGASFLQMAIQIAESHHEWFNGAGYPRGLAGQDIPLAARITALADVYDALRMRRPYKKPMSHAEARAIIVAGSGTQFDPDVVQAFLDCEDRFKAVRYVSDVSADPSLDVRIPPPRAAAATVQTLLGGRVPAGMS